ncbi:MAG: ComF family protein [Bacteroidales bacterium]|jgi:ComF family protein|nr:ComF family protein [Bacteroidales bacterium]
MNKITSLLDQVISFFYPKLCPACGRALQQHEEIICMYCMVHLPETDYYLQEDNPLCFLFHGRVPITQVCSLLFYKKGNLVQHLLHHLKYKGDKEIGEVLGFYFGQKLATSSLYADADMILPIPLHPKKLRARGYNQSECIAQGLGRGMSKPCRNDILVRDIFTQTQTKKNRFRRWENVKDVFKISDYKDINHKKVILCDDVLTTGATIEAAARQLLKGEDVKVKVVTLASAAQ